MSVGRGARRRTGKKAIAGSRRQTKALKLRAKGLTLDQIAERLGYAGRQGAHEAIRAAMERNESDGVAELRKVQGAKLEALWNAVVGKALAGDQKAIIAALKVLQMEARLFGSESARKFEVRHRGTRPADTRLALLEALRKMDAAEESAEEKEDLA